MEPPKDPSVQVRCVQDHGDVMFSIGKVNLTRDTVHLLPREEAEPFISDGVLVYMD
jgi:GINS complex subunit 1